MASEFSELEHLSDIEMSLYSEHRLNAIAKKVIAYSDYLQRMARMRRMSASQIVQEATFAIEMIRCIECEHVIRKLRCN